MRTTGWLTLILLFSAIALHADEGMFLISQTNRMPLERMKKMGMTLSPEALFSPTRSSLKDAVIQFGNGCTGSILSDRGLLLTNHHCGYDVVQQLSSTDRNYLKEGFTARSIEQELPADGLTVAFLRRIVDVTDTIRQIASTLHSTLSPAIIADSIANALAIEASEAGRYRADVVPFFERTQYHLMVYEIYTDIRLVLAPPSYVGKFGGETDNWMWPRHTGDFMFFRVYADANGKPADYSPTNVPLHTPTHLTTSLEGYQKDDLTLTIGYPGATTRYLTSWGIEEVMKGENDPLVRIRSLKQSVWKQAMDSLPELRLKYAATYAGSANYLKHGIGQNEAIVRRRLIEQRQDEEKRFGQWAETFKENDYTTLLPRIKEDIPQRTANMEAIVLIQEAFMNSSDLLSTIFNLMMIDYREDDESRLQVTNLLNQKYPNCDPTVDQQLLAVCMRAYKEQAKSHYLPDIYAQIDKRFGGDIDRYVRQLYRKSLFSDRTKVERVIRRKGIKGLEKDPMWQLAFSIHLMSFEIIGDFNEASGQIESDSRAYLMARMKQFPDSIFAPDANFTMRLSYGSVQPIAQSAYFTTANEIVAKIDPSNEEFHVGKPLVELIEQHAFGNYADADGSLHVALLTSNDITGGNSGSPLLNANGELIGVAFDSNWEGLSGDLSYNAEQQRCINVDIRYVLFIVDQLCQNRTLVNEILKQSY